MLAPLAAALALALAAAPAARPAAVPLTFAWPAGLEGTRSERAEFKGTITGEQSEQKVRLRVARDGEEIRVELADALGEPETLALPALVVVAGPDGGLRRLDGEEPFRRALLEAMRREPGLAEALGPALAAQMEQARERFVTSWLAAERSRWADDVSRWAGKVLVPGEAREELVPARGERTLAARRRFGLRRTLPCPGDASRACVELWATEVTDEDARRRAGAGGDPERGERLRDTAEASTLELVVIAEPATLLPYRSRWSARSRAACEGGLALPGESTAKAERDYAWRRP